LRLASYSDADFAGDKDDRKSVSGVITTINGMMAGWQCKKQSGVALSTAEAEFVAASISARKLKGIKQLAEEVGIPIETPMTMYMDNQAAIKQIENEASSSLAKHVDIRLKFAKDLHQKRIVQPEYVDTTLMLADVLTKALPAPRLQELRAMIGLKSTFPETWGRSVGNHPTSD
jgi:hypothetical protein